MLKINLTHVCHVTYLMHSSSTLPRMYLNGGEIGTTTQYDVDRNLDRYVATIY